MHSTPRFLHRRLILIAAVLLLLPLSIQAQPTTSLPEPSTDAGPLTAYLVRTADALPVVLMSARTSLTRDASEGFTATAADVVVVGPAVKALVTDGPRAETLQRSLDAGVRIVVCEIAMDKVGVTEEDLLDDIDTAPNGFHELFHLQEEGYQTLQL